MKTEVVPLKIQIVSDFSRWSCRHACCGDMFSQFFFQNNGSIDVTHHSLLGVFGG